jgi:hypothetical protein
MLLMAAMLVIAELLKPPVPQHTSILTGARYFEELMGTNNSNRFRTMARINKETFVNLLNLLNLLEG